MIGNHWQRLPKIMAMIGNHWQLLAISQIGNGNFLGNVIGAFDPVVTFFFTQPDSYLGFLFFLGGPPKNASRLKSSPL